MTRKQSVLRYRSLALCVLASGAVASAIAAAAEPNPASEVRSTVVRYHEGDLSHEQGSRAVYARLQAAARQVCGRIDLRDFVAGRAWWTCYSTALDKAVVELGSDRVTALHAASSRIRLGGGPVPSSEHRG